MERTLFAFLNEHYDQSRPLLLALSGGPDSLALLHLLLEYRKKQPLAFGVAHIDHGWRSESSNEANVLQQMARGLELPFHVKRLNPNEIQGNLEAACRLERLKFFSEMCRKHGYQAVVLAHHSDDQTETVLKRVLEGVSLPYLGSMRPISLIEGVTIWRPLLGVRKRDILAWLEERGLQGFDDSTNLNPKFLRGKFRSRLLPLLSSEFGKEVGAAIERLGVEAAHLRDYLEERIKNSRMRIQEGPFGLCLDLSGDCPDHPYELSYLIRKFCEEANLALSRHSIETALQLVLTGAADKQVESGTGCLKIDRRRLFAPKLPFGSLNVQPVQEKKLLKPGQIDMGPWSLSVQECERNFDQKTSNWKDVWSGRGEAWIPADDEYQAGPVQLQASYQGKTSIAKWWTNAKVPAFLRGGVPVIWRSGEVFREFLSGNCPNKDLAFVKKWWRVILEPKEGVYVPVAAECNNVVK